MTRKETLTDKEWEELASIFSDEKNGDYSGSVNDDIHETGVKWKKLRNKENEEPIDVDMAWNNVFSKMTEWQNSERPTVSLFRKNTFLRVAAAILVIIGIGAVSIFVSRTGYFSNEIAIASGDDQINLKVNLPDGSVVFLNRGSELKYQSDFGKYSRNVKLEGEAFFEISANRLKPFTIDAGKAIVKAVGTSFSVLTGNKDSEVEVFVKTGKVLISKKSGDESVELDPGFIGKTEGGNIEKTENNDPNYLAWNTGKLVYKGVKLEIVFRDLKKFYNMEVVADDPAILELPWTSPIDYESQDKIILLICRSFGLSYTKVGDAYHLSEK